MKFADRYRAVIEHVVALTALAALQGQFDSLRPCCRCATSRWGIRDVSEGPLTGVRSMRSRR